MRISTIAIAIPLGALALLIAGCNATPMSQAAFINQAQQLHDQALITATVGEQRLNDYLQAIVRRLHESANAIEPRRAADPLLGRITIHIVNSPTPNIVNTGGQHIYLYNGLLQLAQTEEDLAAILAHGFAHTVRLDVQNTKIRPQPGQAPERVVWQFVTNRLSPQQEQSAEELAFRLYARAGWDVDQFATLYQRMEAAGLGPGLNQKAAQARQWASRVSAEERIWWRQESVADEDTFLQRRAQAATLANRPPPSPDVARLIQAMPNCILPADRPEQIAAQEDLRRIVAPPQLKEPS